MTGELLAAVKAQQESIDRLAHSVGLLTAAVGELLGEELGKPDDGEDAESTTSTMDGGELTFRGAKHG